MNYCKKCGARLGENDVYCTNCGAPVKDQPAAEPSEPATAATVTTVAQPAQVYPPQMQYPPAYPGQGYYPPVTVDPRDHTKDFEMSDISENKIFALASYLLGALGVIIAMIAGKDSPFVKFHVRQALMIHVVMYLLVFLSLIFSWTIIIPVIALVCLLVMFVVLLICFFNAGRGKAKEAPIVSSLPFFK